METVFVVDDGYHTLKHARVSRSQQCGDYLPVYTQRSERDITRVCHREQVVGLLHNLNNITSSCADAPNEVSLLLLQHALVSRREREIVFVSCFERLGCKRVALDCLASTALYAGGVTSGVIVDIGFTGVRVSTILDGHPVLPLCAELRSVGAYHVDADLRHSALHDCSDEDLLHFKTQCTVQPEVYPGGEHVLTSSYSAAHARQSRYSRDKTTSLPDGERVHIHTCDGDSDGDTPCAAEKPSGACQKLLYSSSTSVPNTFSYHMRKALLVSPEMTHWSVIGGCAGMHGVRSILRDAVSHAVLVSAAKEVYVKNAAHAAVQGGIILAQLSFFKGMCITADMYAEDGPERCAQR